MKRKFLLPILFLLLLAVVSAPAQQPATPPNANEQRALVKTFKLDSRLMARQISYNVVLPPSYNTEKDARFPVLYLLHGFGGDYKGYTERTKIPEYAAQHRIIIVFPEGGNSFYTDSTTRPDDKYESYIAGELIPEVDKNLRTIANRKARAVAGFSMGGYGALKFGFKYPDKFVLAASISGSVAAASWRKPEDITSPANIKNAVLSVFGEKNTAALEANDLFKIIGDLPPEKIAGLPFIYFACGTEDFLIGQNRNFATLLFEKKIPHEFRQLPGKHDGVFASPQTQEILRLSERIFAERNEASKK
jgi:S-formylglutathione hydrolase FrmB